MRIAVSGTHRIGKTTLISHLITLLPHYDDFEEPYHLLEQDGVLFADPPSLEDFEAQLERALELSEEGGLNLLFDPCPVDFLAYIRCHPDAGAFDVDRWLPDIKMAMARFDLVVRIPLDRDQRQQPVPASADAVFRECVDEALHSLLIEDELDLQLRIQLAPGDLKARAAAVMEAVRRAEGT